MHSEHPEDLLRKDILEAASTPNDFALAPIEGIAEHLVNQLVSDHPEQSEALDDPAVYSLLVKAVLIGMANSEVKLHQLAQAYIYKVK